MATITSTQTGNWTAGSTWVGGVAPAVTDDVVIDTGHTVTKDNAISAPDCVSLTITGTLVISSTNGLQMTGTLAFTGELQLNDTAEFDYSSSTNSTVGGLLTLAGTAVGTGGVTMTCSQGGQITYTNQLHSIQNAIFDKTGSGDAGFLIGNRLKNEIVGCDFKTVSGTGLQGNNGTQSVKLRDCFFYGGAYGFYAIYDATRIDMVSCVFGKQRDGTSDTHSVADIFVRPEGAIYKMFNCLLTSANPFLYDLTDEPNMRVNSYAHNQDSASWYMSDGYGVVELVSGELEFSLLVDHVQATPYHVFAYELAIPIEYGDVISAFTIQTKIPTGWSGASGDFYFEVDPGNYWGLEETVQADYTNENTFRTNTFTGGTANGGDSSSGDKGTLILRIYMAQYVSAAVVTVKPPVYTLS